MKDETRNKLLNWLQQFANTSDGQFLNEIDYKSVPFDWSSKCNAENGIMGMYAFGKIWLMQTENVPECIFPTLAHEMLHRWQFKKHPIMYLIGKIYRPLIENPADEITNKAETWINEKLK